MISFDCMFLSWSQHCVVVTGRVIDVSMISNFIRVNFNIVQCIASFLSPYRWFLLFLLRGNQGLQQQCNDIKNTFFKLLDLLRFILLYIFLRGQCCNLKQKMENVSQKLVFFSIYGLRVSLYIKLAYIVSTSESH